MGTPDDLPSVPREPPAGGADRRRSPIWPPIVCVILCLLLVAAGQVVAHLRLDDSDHWLYAYFGERLLAGDAMYADLWDVKPPLNYWLNAVGLWVAHGSYGGVMGCYAVVAVLTLWSLYAGCRAFCRRNAALLATLVGAIYLTHSYYFGGTNRPETLEIFFELIAAALYLRHLRRFSAWRIFLAGAACGLAIGAKQSGAALFIAIMLDQLGRLLWFAPRRGPAAAGLGLVLIGLVVGTAAWLVPVLLEANGEEVYTALVAFHRLHLRSAHVNPFMPQIRPIGDKIRILALPIVLAVAAVLHAALSTRFVRRRMAPASDSPESEAGDAGRTGVPVLVLWFLLALYGIALAPQERLHFWLLIVPPLLLLSARAIALLAGELGVLDAMRRKMSTTLAVVVAGYLAYQALTLQVGRVAQAWYYREEALHPAVPCKIAEVINADAAAGDTVFVWGNAPEILWHLHRPCATRFAGTHFFELHDGLGQPLFDEAMRALKKAPPRYVLVGGDLGSLSGRLSAEYGLDISEFDNFLESAYDTWKVVGGNTIYRLRRGAR